MKQVSRENEGRWGCYQSVLRGIEGNSLAIRGSSHRGSPCLSLVWKQEGILSEKEFKGDGRDRQVVPQKGSLLPWYRKGWQWLNDNGSAIQAVAIIGGIVWFMAAIHFRLAELESGVAGISSSVTAMNEKLIRVEAKQEIVDKYVLPQIFGSKAAALLGTSDVGVFKGSLTLFTTK